MEDERIWKLERSLWTGDGELYREMIDGVAVRGAGASFHFAG